MVRIDPISALPSLVAIFHDYIIMPFTTEELKEMAGIFASALYGEESLPGQRSPIEAAATISTVRVRLPKFLDFNPELWFAQCEAVFDLSRVTAEKTKFNHCIAGLEPEVLRKVQAFIRNPDDNLPYTKFKEGLLRATVKPVPQRLQEVMDLRLGDRRPSDLLHLMEESWPEADPNNSLVFKQLFLQKLPPCLQPALASSELNLADLALLADSQVASLRNLNLQTTQSPLALSASVCPSSHDSESAI